MHVVRILVVDDFEPWRRFSSAAIELEPQLQLIGEASDGLEAVQKSKELKPDLILLDIGLPKLDGIAAARQIRTVSPNSKILFVSQNSSAAVVKEAMELGAGFVVKTDAGTELLSAVKGVMSGQQFLSTTAQADKREETATELAQEEMQ